MITAAQNRTVTADVAGHAFVASRLDGGAVQLDRLPFGAGAFDPPRTIAPAGSAPVVAGGGLGGMAGPSTLPGLTFGPTAASSAASVAAVAPVSVTIIGPNDPQAQRQMQELIRNANRRGNIMGA